MTPFDPLGNAWPIEQARPLSTDRAVSEFSPSARANDEIRGWLDALAEWNRRMDLTAAKSSEQALELMLTDAWVLAAHLKEAARVVDVGSGAGAPGLALALMRPDLKVTLVEPLTKRVSFLRTVLAKVGRADVQVVRDRGEEVKKRGERFDVAVSRATLAPGDWLCLGLALVDEGQTVWVLLAKDSPPSHEHAKLQREVDYESPLGKAPRKAVEYAKVPRAL